MVAIDSHNAVATVALNKAPKGIYLEFNSAAAIGIERAQDGNIDTLTPAGRCPVVIEEITDYPAGSQDAKQGWLIKPS